MPNGTSERSALSEHNGVGGSACEGALYPVPAPERSGMICRSNFARVLRMSNDLFGGELLPPDAKSKPASRKASTQEPQPMLRPLAERMRPGTLDEVVGQTHLLGAGAPLRTAFEQHRPHSMILWGLPASARPRLPA